MFIGLITFLVLHRLRPLFCCLVTRWCPWLGHWSHHTHPEQATLFKITTGVAVGPVLGIHLHWKFYISTHSLFEEIYSEISGFTVKIFPFIYKQNCKSVTKITKNRLNHYYHNLERQPWEYTVCEKVTSNQYFTLSTSGFFYYKVGYL